MYRINDTINIIFYLAKIILILYFDEKLHKLFPSIDCFIVNMNYEYENAKVVTDCYMKNCMSSISVSAVNNKTEKRLLSKILHIKSYIKKNCIYVI